LITVGPSFDRRRQVKKPKGKPKRSENPLHRFDRHQEHAEETIEKGDQGIAEQKPQAKLIPLRPFVQRLAAKRHHDSGESGQRHRDLSGGRQGFTWFHRFGLDRIQLARTNTNFGRVV